MRLLLAFVLIFSALGINGQNVDDWQLFSQCDRTVGSGVAACVQYFSPIKFVTDVLNGDKDSLCCQHFRQNTCIRGVRESVRLAKAANLCPDSYFDMFVGAVTDSTVNEYIVKKCLDFNAQKCVMDSVGDVVNTISGYFIPQQQQPVIPQLIQRVPQLFSRGDGNAYSADDNVKNHNLNSNNDYINAGSDLFNPIRELFNRKPSTTSTTTANPLIETIGNFYDRQYIPEASNVRPIKDSIDPLRSLFGSLGLIGDNKEEKKDKSLVQKDNIGNTEDQSSSLLGGFGTLLNSGLDIINGNNTNGDNFFSDIFNLNNTDISDAIN